MTEKSQDEWNRLLEKAKSGDPNALEQLCQKIRVRLWPILQYRLCGRPCETLEDILQDTMATFVEKFGDIKTNPQQYALKILYNKIGDAYRGRSGARDISLSSHGLQDDPLEKSLGERDPQIADSRADFLDDLIASDLKDHITRAVKRLSKFCQMYILAVFLEGRDLEEVLLLARELEPKLTRNAFDQRTRRCLERLRQLVNPSL